MRRIPTPPKCPALLVAQAVTRDDATHRCTIINTFSVVQVKNTPAVVSEIAVYYLLERGDADIVDVHLALIAPDGSITYQTSTSINWGKGESEEFVVPWQNVVLKSAGDFTWRLFMDGAVLAERRIIVKLAG